MNTLKRLEARENVIYQVAMGFISFASAWWRGWHEFSGPIRNLEQHRDKQKFILNDSRLAC